MAQLTIAQAAEKWGVSRRTVQKWIDSGRLPAKKLDELHRERGLPTTGIDAWVILTDERPQPSMAPIDRPKREEEVAQAAEQGTVEGYWGWKSR